MIKEWNHQLNQTELEAITGKFVRTGRITPREASALLATIRELREVLELCCCAESEQCSKNCGTCDTARRIRAAQQ